MNTPFDSFSFEYQGRKFTADLYYDETADKPWENCDLLGRVYCRVGYENFMGQPNKKPGERVLSDAGYRGAYWLYDWQGATKRARAEGIENIETAVKSDFEYVRRWLTDEWYYIGMVVTDGEGRSDSLWGIESDADDYHKEAAEELARQLLYERERETFPIYEHGV